MKCRDSSLRTAWTTAGKTGDSSPPPPRKLTCPREAQLGQAHGLGISIHSTVSLPASAQQETESTGNHIARCSQKHGPSLCTD